MPPPDALISVPASALCSLCAKGHLLVCLKEYSSALLLACRCVCVFICFLYTTIGGAKQLDHHGRSFCSVGSRVRTGTWGSYTPDRCYQALELEAIPGPFAPNMPQVIRINEENINQFQAERVTAAIKTRLRMTCTTAATAGILRNIEATLPSDCSSIASQRSADRTVRWQCRLNVAHDARRCRRSTGHP